MKNKQHSKLSTLGPLPFISKLAHSSLLKPVGMGLDQVSLAAKSQRPPSNKTHLET
jgi:hypothetical protein